ncbi:MAG: HRDC domain-containing protein [Desulfuromonadales bacterium]|nr:HRDC domain-containing protein [Desulfuromonadales bacterium]
MKIFELITSNEALQSAGKHMLKEPLIACDVEADSMYHYQEQVCLLQISTLSKIFIIDPLADLDISTLAPIFSDPNICKIFHGADYDVRMMHQCFGIEISNLFDTMIACQFLGEPAVGLAAIIKKRFGIELNKRFQQADWAKRPLSEDMLEYAVEDTNHLIPLYHMLVAELTEKNRLTWVLEECKILSQVRMTDRKSVPLLSRFKGVSKIPKSSLAILEGLLKFRDQEAQHRNLPPFKVIGNKTITEIAERSPVSVADLSHISGLTDKIIERYGYKIISAVKKGKESKVPVLEKKTWSNRPNIDDNLLKTLKNWRIQKSTSLGMLPGITINNSILEKLAESPPKENKELKQTYGMKNWQIEIFGKELLDLFCNNTTSPNRPKDTAK